MKKWVLCALPLTLACLSAQQWYSSNQSGMRISQLDGPASQGWFLEINGGSRVLHHNGEEVEKWIERSDNGERSVEYWQGEQLRELRAYLADGQLDRVDYFTGGEPDGSDRYRYRGRWLIRIEHLDTQGRLVWKKDYQRRTNGSMVSSSRIRVSNGKGEITYALVDAGQARLTKRGANQRLELFDSSGNLIQKKEYHGDTLFRQLDYRRRDGLVVEQIVSYPEREEVRTLRYNADGQQLSERMTVGGRLLEAVNYRYGEDSLLREEERIGREVVTLRYTYKPGTRDVDSIDYYQRGTLIRTRFDFQPEPASYSEKFYVGGQPMVLRVYRNNALVKEKLLQKAEQPAQRIPPQGGL